MRLGSPYSHRSTQPGISDKSAGKYRKIFLNTHTSIPRQHHQPLPGGKKVCVLLSVTPQMRVCVCAGVLFHSLFGSEGNSNMLFLFTQ